MKTRRLHPYKIDFDIGYNAWYYWNGLKRTAKKIIAKPVRIFSPALTWKYRMLYEGPMNPPALRTWAVAEGFPRKRTFGKILNLS